jgi:hypothetical protein
VFGLLLRTEHNFYAEILILHMIFLQLNQCVHVPVIMSINIRLTKINVIKAMPRAPILADDDLLSVALMYLFFVFVNVETSTVRLTRI